MNIIVNKISDETLKDGLNIWNEVVEAGKAFPQTEKLSLSEAEDFFQAQSYTGVAVDSLNGEVVGIYILHPNNVGRCGHICNASYAVKSSCRGRHIGEYLVKDCMEKAKSMGFKILQFNAVVKSNTQALRLYNKFGFIQLGVIKNGFKNIDGVYEDIIPHYITL